MNRADYDRYPAAEGPDLFPIMKGEVRKCASAGR